MVENHKQLSKQLRLTRADMDMVQQKQFEAGYDTKAYPEEKWAPLPRGYKYVTGGVKTSWVPSRTF